MSTGDNLALLTDLYQLTMAQAYLENGKIGPATFSLFVRNYPTNRGYLVSAGLADVLDFLENFSFDEAAIDYLRSTRLFGADFLDFLKGVRFTGEVWALPEGRLFFTDEPLLEVTAPIIEAQIVETFIINQINLQSLIATKAARCVHAGRGRSVVDFALRRTQGIDAGMKVARASYLAGFSGTSNVRAGQRYGIPIVGTMAHSFVSSFSRESDAFRAFAATFPNNSVLLIDTYDTIRAAHEVVSLAHEMAARGQRVQGVRIDSGDLVELAKQVRKIFDAAGLKNIKIVGSGGLDEYDLADFSDAEAPYDSYGVGTRMGVSADAPWLDIAYKLVEHGGRPVLKLSPGKVSWPGKKQFYRELDSQGRLQRDVIALRDERLPGMEPLLKKVIERGKVLLPRPTLDDARNTFIEEFARLADPIKAIRNPSTYPVEFTPALKSLLEHTEREINEQDRRPG